MLNAILYWESFLFKFYNPRCPIKFGWVNGDGYSDVGDNYCLISTCNKIITFVIAVWLYPRTVRIKVCSWKIYNIYDQKRKDQIKFQICLDLLLKSVWIGIIKISRIAHRMIRTLRTTIKTIHIARTVISTIQLISLKKDSRVKLKWKLILFSLV